MEEIYTVYKADFAFEFAFKCGGVDYFEFVDKHNLPYERGIDTLTFYQENAKQGHNRLYIRLTNAAMNKLLSDPKKINLNESLSYKCDLRSVAITLLIRKLFTRSHQLHLLIRMNH